MKVLKYLSVLILGSFLLSCSSDDDAPAQTNVNVFVADAHFIQDGVVRLSSADCIDSGLNYAIAIEVSANGTGSFEPFNVTYSFNGETRNLSFRNAGSQQVGVVLQEGLNTFSVNGTSFSQSIALTLLPEFEVVE